MDIEETDYLTEGELLDVQQSTDEVSERESEPITYVIYMSHSAGIKHFVSLRTLTDVNFRRCLIPRRLFGHERDTRLERR